MVTSPIKIRHSYRFSFAFLELLFFFPLPVGAGVMGLALGGQEEGRRMSGGGLASGRGAFSQCVSRRKSLPGLWSVTVARCFSGRSFKYLRCCVSQGARNRASLCVPPARFLLWVHWWYTALVSLNLKYQRDRGQKDSIGFGSKFTGRNSTYGALYASGQCLARKPLSSGSIHSLSWKKNCWCSCLEVLKKPLSV